MQFEESFDDKTKQLMRKYADLIDDGMDSADIVVLVARKAIALYRALVADGVVKEKLGTRLISSYGISFNRNIFAGARVMVIDDVMLSGRSSVQVVNRIVEAGGVPFVLVPAFSDELCTEFQLGGVQPCPLVSAGKLDRKTLYGLAGDIVAYILRSGGTLMMDLPYFSLSHSESRTLLERFEWWDYTVSEQSKANISAKLLVFDERAVDRALGRSRLAKAFRGMRGIHFEVHMIARGKDAASWLIPKIGISAISESCFNALASFTGCEPCSTCRNNGGQDEDWLKDTYRYICFSISAYMGRFFIGANEIVPRLAIVRDESELLFGRGFNLIDVPDPRLRTYCFSHQAMHISNVIKESSDCFVGLALSTLLNGNGEGSGTGHAITRSGIESRLSFRYGGMYLSERQSFLASVIAVVTLMQRGLFTPHITVRSVNETLALFQNLKAGEVLEPTEHGLYLTRSMLERYCHNTKQPISSSIANRLSLLYIRLFPRGSGADDGDVEKALRNRVVGEGEFQPRPMSFHVRGVSAVELLGFGDRSAIEPSALICSLGGDSATHAERAAYQSFAKIFADLYGAMDEVQFKDFLDELISGYLYEYRVSCLEPYVVDVCDMLRTFSTITELLDSNPNSVMEDMLARGRFECEASMRQVIDKGLDMVMRVKSIDHLESEIEEKARLISDGDASTYSANLGRFALSERESVMDQRLGQYMIEGTERLLTHIQHAGQKRNDGQRGGAGNLFVGEDLLGLSSSEYFEGDSAHTIWTTISFSKALRQRYVSVRQNDFKLLGGEVISVLLFRSGEVRYICPTFYLPRVYFDLSALEYNSEKIQHSVVFLSPGLRPSWIPITRNGDEQKYTIDGPRYLEAVYPKAGSGLINSILHTEGLYPGASRLSVVFASPEEKLVKEVIDELERCGLCVMSETVDRTLHFDGVKFNVRSIDYKNQDGLEGATYVRVDTMVNNYGNIVNQGNQSAFSTNGAVAAAAGSAVSELGNASGNNLRLEERGLTAREIEMINNAISTLEAIDGKLGKKEEGTIPKLVGALKKCVKAGKVVVDGAKIIATIAQLSADDIIVQSAIDNIQATLKQIFA